MRGGGPRLAKSPDRHEGREVKLSYVHGVGTTPLIADTIGGALNGAAERWGDRDALVACHQQLRYSYRELRDEADRAARALIALGVQRGDRVGIWSGNRAEWMITQYAAAKAGAVLVNINPAYRLRELEYALTQSGVSVLIAARGFRSTDYVEMLLGLMPELTATGTGPIQAQRVPALRRVIYLGTDAEPGGIAWAEFLDLGNRIAARELEARETALQFDDPINIQYTSGTTGSPKGATLSHHNILNNGYFVGEVLRYTEHDRICAAGPVLSLLRLRAWQHGGRHARQRGGHPWRVVRSGRHAAGDRGGAAARPSTGCRRCSSRSWTIPASAASSSRRCAPESWPALPVRLTSCARSSAACTCRRSPSATA